MPEGIGYGNGDRVARLFAMRLARRRGEMDADDPELSSFGESLGIAGPKPAPTPAPAPTAAPQAASTMPPQKNTGIPALDALSEMPRKRSRGLVHDRKLGRVMKAGM